MIVRAVTAPAVAATAADPRRPEAIIDCFVVSAAAEETMRTVVPSAEPPM